MIETLYATLAKFGFSHPLHPMLTHLPMGMVIGMVVFSLLSLIWKGRNLDTAAYYCSILAFFGVFPVISAGILDWQQLMEGEWNTYIIIKMILATLLTLLLAFSIIEKRRGGTAKKIFLLYILCLACAGGLGFSGGQLVFG
ncbi:MAG: hypothetical protein JRC87_06430 [Deltaproteobacteria bacterium]|nr:hypothetical protein [Deltaproteobacteria bacterium]